MKQKYLKYVMGLSAFSFICWGVLFFTQFHENISNSLEGIRYILFLKTCSNGFIGNPTIKRGDIVSIQGYEPAYVGKKPFAKRVLGLPGDFIFKDKKKVIVAPRALVFEIFGSETPVSKILVSEILVSEIHASAIPMSKTFTVKNSMSGTAVPMASEFVTLPLLEKTSQGKPLTPISAAIVPEGYVFVAGDNPNSFDSRYEEFGLVPIEKIWGKAVFTWE